MIININVPNLAAVSPKPTACGRSNGGTTGLGRLRFNTESHTGIKSNSLY